MTPLRKAVAAAVWLAAGAALAQADAKLAPVACPAGVPADARCLGGIDSAGAHVRAALPRDWNGVLVVHVHGGPELGTPKPGRVDDDLKRWSIWPRAGFAYVASGFRQGGVEVRAAAEDSERARRLFVEQVAAPRRTILHGQSWGAGVAAKGAEQPGLAYDGVLLTSGVLGGAARNYEFRLDLRVVWQAVCGNHPRPGEPAYPLWQGLPQGATMARADLDRRVDECTGLRQPAAQRSAEQQKRLATLLAVLKLPERTLAAHLGWATWHFQDIAWQRAGGNVFGNDGVRYRGSDDDDALNAKVVRYRADAGALARFDADAGLTGRIDVPVLSLHAVDDPTAFVELESSLRETMAAAGRERLLLQLFTSDREHSYLSDVQYVAAMQALLQWLDRGERPLPQAVSEACAALQARWGDGCRLLPGYRPAPLADRVPAR